MDDNRRQTPLRILFLEDNPDDRELVARALAMDGLACELVHAETRQEFETALMQDRIDLILADFSLPGYNGMAALATARERRGDVPFILVSGTIGEEQAVESLKSGATDYLLKGRVERLAPAVRRALREAEMRRAHREAERA